jgi:HSP20 family protein
MMNRLNLVRWTPWREMTTLNDRFDRIFEEPFFRSGLLDNEGDLSEWSPTVDIYHNDEAIVITAELPGMEKKDIAIDIKGGVLTLKGERSHEDHVKEENYYRRERRYGKFHKAFKLSDDVAPEKIKADLKNGVLKIEIPKPEERKPRKITVH